jgi:SMC interacting uncharacterized protein involved in chromosome segregation
MDFKAMALTATLGGTVLLSGLTFTGALDLTDIKNKGFEWGNKVSLAVDETKQMASKFNLFKSDTETLINEKIAKINDLNAKISELVAKVGSGEISLEDANNEIARLNEELQKANTEIEALKNEFASKDTEVQTAFAEMATAESLDTTLALDQQSPDTVIPEGTQAPETEPEPEQPPVNEFTTQETAIHNALVAFKPALNDVVVTMTETSVTLQGSTIRSEDTSVLIPMINNAVGITITGVQYPNSTTYKFNY